MDDQTRDQWRERGVRLMSDPRRKAQCAEAGRNVMRDPKALRRSIEAGRASAQVQKALFADPVLGQRLREKCSARSKAYWSNPANRLAQSERKKRLYANGHNSPPNGRTSPSEKWLRAKLEAEGCKVFATGWPDFLVVRPDGHVKAIEVKSGSDRVRPDQAAVHEILRALGIEVEVVYVAAEEMEEAAA